LSSLIAMGLANYHLPKDIPISMSEYDSESAVTSVSNSWRRVKFLITTWTLGWAVVLALHQHFHIAVLALLVNVLPVVASHLDSRLLLLIVPFLPVNADARNSYMSRLSKLDLILNSIMALVIAVTFFSYTFLSDHVGDHDDVYFQIAVIFPIFPLVVIIVKSSTTAQQANTLLAAPELTTETRLGLERLMWFAKADSLCLPLYYLYSSSHLTFVGHWDDVDFLAAIWNPMFAIVTFHFAFSIYNSYCVFENYLPYAPTSDNAIISPQHADTEETRLLGGPWIINIDPADLGRDGLEGHQMQQL
jgi:hypothetical protein